MQIYFMRTEESAANRTRMVASHIIRLSQPQDPYAPSHSLPTGADYLALMQANAKFSEVQSASNRTVDANRDLIGTSLCALYQAATCHRKCWNTGHVFESLCGRAHNLGAAAYNLILLGYYDEALNLVRAIGETNNIVLLSVFDKTAFAKWLQAGKKTRLREFSPVKVRLLLEAAKDCAPVLADEDWYAELCEKYVHISAQTLPNMHNDKTPVVGGVFQERGMEESLEALGQILAALALLVCRYFQYEDLTEMLRKHVAKEASSGDAAAPT
ncbi:MAG: hypothetical protein GEV13_16270 [Rhodospirillales bacterium]|nr:hypothetical protein [Rhodospirillales bacterium]